MKQLRVLIVEDSEDDALLILHELEREGYEVSHLRVDTLDALRSSLRRCEWDIVISDFSLPSFTAMDSLRVLDESGLDLPCIIISGSISEQTSVDAMRAGARDFFTKDRMARLLPAVSRELEEAAQRRRRRAAEVALSEAKDRMRFALDAANVGTWEAHIVERKADWSARAEMLHGLREGEFGGTFEAFIATVHPDDRDRVRRQVAESRRGGQAEARTEYRVIWPDGSIHWIVDVGRTFYDADGTPVRAAGVSMDVTAQRNLEEQFHQAQKMESIGNLAGGIAHDFNNLLTAILGYSSVLLEDEAAGLQPEVVRSFIEEIQKAGERAASLTNQLLAFSRRQMIQPTVLDINAVIGALDRMLQRLIGEDIELTTNLDPTLGSTRADPGQIEQVIMNLVVNARDAMPTGGKITIETRNTELDEAYSRQHIAVPPGRYVMLAVSDTGTGMTPAVQARIFEPFFTTKPKGRGTGLGLATIYGIVKQNHGDIWVYSEPGKGTSFKVYLPRVDDAPIAVPAKATTVPTGRGEAVLLVEDDHRVRKLARELLTRNGYEVIEGADAEDAIRVAASYHKPIDLLLTDVVMPGMSGRLLAQRLAEHHPHLKILYMSGYTDDAIVHHGVLTPDIAFLQKPFTPSTFARAVRDVLDTRPPRAE
jgi:two-component system cell cycle sensor histidine kinase/response regulator CckA